MYGFSPYPPNPPSMVEALKTSIAQAEDLKKYLEGREKKPEPFWQTKMTLTDTWMLMLFFGIVIAIPIEYMLRG
jgi:hypothetical protein